MNKKPIGIEELKNIELDLLISFKKVCDANGLNYSLGGGTLLGAVRHKGFIPWDDDIDVMMPRDDYDRFIDYCKNNTTSFNLLSIYTDANYGYLFSKIYNPNTFLTEEKSNRLGCETGVSIDIFPIDGLGNTYNEALKNFRKDRIRREILVASNWKKYFFSKTHSWYYEPIRFAFYIVSRFFNPNKLAKSIDFNSRKYCNSGYNYSAVLCGAYRDREIHSSNLYFSYHSMKFENEIFNGLEQYDEYLQSHYGDYMQLPPTEKRVTHHMFDAYWRK